MRYIEEIYLSRLVLGGNDYLKDMLGIEKTSVWAFVICYTGVQTWVLFVLVTVSGSVKLSFRKTSISKSIPQL